MRRLLSHLAQFSAFSKQGEVLCTRGLEFLLEHETARVAFARQLASGGVVKGADTLRWHAEVRQGDNARPDLEGRTADGQPAVKVEAKLGAGFGEHQLESYARDLVQRAGGGLLLILVPRYRMDEARQMTAKAGLPHGVVASVSSWEQVIDDLREVRVEPFASDLAQFEAMYRVLCGEDLEPLADEAAIRAWREREQVFVHYIDRATRLLSKGTRLLPLVLDRKMSEPRATGTSEAEDAVGGTSSDSPTGVPPGAFLHRYVLCFEGGKKPTYFSIGVRDPFESHSTPIWLRFHRDTGGFVAVRERLRSAPELPGMITSGGHLWIPLEVPLHAQAASVVDALVEQAERIRRCARALTDV